ncbi:excisionase [Chlorobaculum limnaeum]|uniref:Excisionase n=1 Tax=Chlorobaculum limnaeum TaxID=274537 RepID=A0A1D8CZK9_CHLLM|nr:helix-turn-helix domain-containing protein [Chlorobaculum limnaeum]AOS84376.1 excisionase [Chlorobaculum limnaeum]
MDYSQTRAVSPDDRLMAAIRIIVRQELATVLTSPEPKDRLLTVAEAASFLRLAVPTIYGLVQRNQIPYIKKTKRLYFSERKLNEWLEKGENDGPAGIERAVDTYLTLRKSSRKRCQ